jgi:hypothetical protein
VTTREFTRALGRALHRPAVLVVPPFALKVAFGRELADELLLGGARVLPARLTESGFSFRDLTVDGALEAAIRTH